MFAGDHAGSTVPHLHGFVTSGEIIVELLADGSVRLSKAHGSPVRGKATARDQKVVLTTAADNFELLLGLWKESRPR